eukprot:SAG25_NODE_288_length_10343_cov_3.673858_17_plen_98_part_00
MITELLFGDVSLLGNVPRLKLQRLGCGTVPKDALAASMLIEKYKALRPAVSEQRKPRSASSQFGNAAVMVPPSSASNQLELAEPKVSAVRSSVRAGW